MRKNYGFLMRGNGGLLRRDAGPRTGAKSHVAFRVHGTAASVRHSGGRHPARDSPGNFFVRPPDSCLVADEPIPVAAPPARSRGRASSAWRPGHGANASIFDFRTSKFTGLIRWSSKPAVPAPRDVGVLPEPAQRDAPDALAVPDLAA